MTPHASLRLGIAALLALLPASSSAETFARLPDGRRILYHCQGKGSPTVLLEASWAGAHGHWGEVQPHVAKLTRVCSYDRAGYGRSDSGPLPRDGDATVRDLRAILDAARIRGPYVLAGHSAGGLYARLFADRYPKEVVGMVLVDSSVEHQVARMEAISGQRAGGRDPLRERQARCLEAAEAGELPSQEPELARCYVGASTYRHRISEYDSLWTSTSAAIAAGRQSYGDMPLVVLTANRTGGNAGGRAAWAQLHAEVAARSTRGEQRIIASGHMMTRERPDAIVLAITDIVRAARGK